MPMNTAATARAVNNSEAEFRSRVATYPFTLHKGHVARNRWGALWGPSSRLVREGRFGAPQVLDSSCCL
eukprot:3062598-Prymnesium_polylepis.1